MGLKSIIAKVKSLFSSKPPESDVQTCPKQKKAVKTGLGTAVDSLAAQSPTLQANLKQLKNDRWKIEYGEAGKGSYADRNNKKIVIDRNEKDNPTGVVQTLAHESGHAMYTPDPYVSPTGKARDEYVAANVSRDLKDEGEATLTNCKVRSEILDNGGADIGIAGTQTDKYQAIYEKYPDAKDRDVARAEIGNQFATGEHPSTDPGKTYQDYYAKPYQDHFDSMGSGS